MGFRVLIVDDSEAMRTVIRRILEMSGFEVAECLEAGDGSEALELLRHHEVDVILTDINMPGVNGEQLVRWLRRDEALRKVPVLVVSTDATPIRIQRVLGLGANGYVTKPFVPETLRAELERAMGVTNG